MMDSIALAKIAELRSQTLQEQWRRDEDAFYQHYGAETPVLFAWIGNLLDRSYAWLKTKKTDRPETGRSVCDGGDRCGQAASARM